MIEAGVDLLEVQSDIARYPGPIFIDSRSGYRWIAGLTIDRCSDRLLIDIGPDYRSISDPDIRLIFKTNKVKQASTLATLLLCNASCYFEANPLSFRAKPEILPKQAILSFQAGREIPPELGDRPLAPG
uniref:Uncharacterized protein n=1 Tax=Candidatus Kentrum sp. MB TaxID=2138164 RepID=A0A450XSX5_9GAMM|nr:MAG: hypothetical protein BECKMB1821G_GA0114241_103436 [Candidatus Kentron sp. MB]VFK32379.1 MAG: hypothetical protein BECKMB1821I_GA0114274_103234 [Candidatus Kentron sp. MB]VFK75860.1 MAG: hypothetical protein BECKMB1821H_GA0114242_103334 [Candidatus Kentron sp. MB]